MRIPLEPGPVRPLALATLVNTVGNGVMMTTSVLYFTRRPERAGIGALALQWDTSRRSARRSPVDCNGRTSRLRRRP